MTTHIAFDEHAPRIVGRKIAFGRSLALFTRAELERTSLRIVTSKAFAEGGLTALQASSIETLERNARAIQLARAHGL